MSFKLGIVMVWANKTFLFIKKIKTELILKFYTKNTLFYIKKTVLTAWFR